jgi:Protein of unknown function (DUF3618)
MTSSDRRTRDQIRADIAAERRQLNADLAALGAEAKRTGRLAGSGVAALGTLLVGLRLLTRRRGR